MNPYSAAFTCWLSVDACLMGIEITTVNFDVT